jgi:uncharacterized protein (TIGR03067 family)
MISPLLGLAPVDEPQAGLERLQGTWRVVKSYSSSGREVPQDFLKRFDTTITIQGDLMTMREKLGDGYREVKSRFDLFPTQSPKAIDDWGYRLQNPPIKGIYQADANKLQFAWGSETRPKELGPCPENSKEKWSYIVYERVTR